MPSLSSILLDKEILLESGTNELELLVFDVADYRFGINVAKVREVLPASEITILPKAHRSIRGVFKLRNQVIPCVSLLDHLGIRPTQEKSESTMILTDLNQQQTAFLVDEVERIHRLSWENILAVPGLDALSHTPVTALARCDQRLIVMLDFEMILDDVTERYFRTDEVANPCGLARDRLHLLLAEDSPTVREAIGQTLRKSGYTHLDFFENGAQCWQWIEERFRATGQVQDVGDLLIADVEMPQVDGFHLTRRVKEHPQLREIPVLLYSSIITPDNRKKGTAVGADAQVAKPELAKVVELADQLIVQAQQANRARGMTAVAERLQDATTAPACGPAEHSPACSKESLSADSPRPLAGEGQGVRVSNPETASVPPSENPLPASGPTAGVDTVSPEVEECANEPSQNAPRPLAAEVQEVRTEVNPHLWGTFRRELIGRVAQLREFLQQAESGRLNEESLKATARTLHTIKSAAMVVPLHGVTRSTHLAESLLAAFRETRPQWPTEPMKHYIEWLDQLTACQDDPEDTLAAGRAVEVELSQLVVESPVGA
jgi:two-component system chemotaxis response regulator CheV